MADLTRIEVGTRAEVVAERRAAVAPAEASLTRAQRTFDRIKQVTEDGFEPVAKLDEASLDVARRTLEQATLACQGAIARYTVEERGVAQVAVAKAETASAILHAQVSEMTDKAPIGGQVYEVGVELGDYVSSGVSLLSLVDLNDVWLRFDLRKDLVRNRKAGDRFTTRIPALDDIPVTVAVRPIAKLGELNQCQTTQTS